MASHVSTPPSTAVVLPPGGEDSSGVSAARRRSSGQARERLLRAALARFDADGILGPTLEDIRGDAGVSVGALYHHFPDKAALACALYVELIHRVSGALPARASAHMPERRTASRRAFAAYLRWVSSNRAAAAFLLSGHPEHPDLRECNRRFFGEVMDWWKTHVHYGALRALQFDVIHALWLGPAQEYTRNWVAGQAKRVPRTVASVLADAAWHTLKEPA